jgi:hypothetical protein
MPAQVGRDGGVGHGLTDRTGASVPLIFGDLRGQGRQFRDRMPRRFGVVRACFLRQGMATASAEGRNEGDDLVQTFGRQPSLQGRQMAGLAAGFFAGGFLTTGLGAWGGLAEGGREELEAFLPRCSWRLRTRSVSVASCCCKRAMIASRCRYPGQEDASMTVF